jgi:putative spermidine/putrescine transport system ATP-binding protein
MAVANGSIELAGVVKSYDDGVTRAVDGVNLKIPDGSYCCFLGPSGCGKTTILRMIAGHEDPTDGEILIGGEDVVGLPPVERKTAMMFQSYALFPHLSVRDNIAFALRVRGMSSAERRRAADEMIEKVRLTELADRLPGQLSGGQQQRVALARALIMQPQVLLLDEPLGALDLKLRKEMQAELRRIHRSLGGTFVFVTHDQEEALGLANRIAVMEAGRIVQQGEPRAVYREPATSFVSTFIGDANLLKGERRNGTVALACGGMLASPGRDGPVNVVIRPEAFQLAESPRISGTMTDLVYLGAYTKLMIELDDKTEIAVHLPDGNRDTLPSPGARVAIAWQDHNVRCIDAA